MENKELSRYPRSLSEHYNFGLIGRLYESGGSVALDLIVYLANHQMNNLFGENWFSINDFCKTMGYDRTKLHRKLSSEQLKELFGKRSPEYIRTEADGGVIKHPIETVFEAALYRLGMENITFPIQNLDGSTSYKFVQIITKFDIKSNFQTKKDTKRLYSATLNSEIKDSLFTHYNLIDLQDYRKIPDRTGYRYFYLNLSKMIYLIKYKIEQKQAPYFTLTVNQLAKIFDVNIVDNNNRKTKVATILKTINKYLNVTKFQFDFVKGENEKWAYTVQFYFPEDTLEYFNEKFNAIFMNKFYSALLRRYVELAYAKYCTGIGAVSNMIDQIKKHQESYEKFLKWAHSTQSLDIKEQVYRTTFIEVFENTPENLGLELFSFSFK